MIIELDQNQLRLIGKVKLLIDCGQQHYAESYATMTLARSADTDKEKLRLCFAQLGLYV